mmetsp:Transcript_63373/g.196323  ORF Transcript_63373/g.196323 Transcript_63373/m.196323 type:complete len:578 (+) Transcript_63373:86-1819(+)
MGVMRKLSFWKKSKTSVVEPFEAPGDETDGEEVQRVVGKEADDSGAEAPSRRQSPSAGGSPSQPAAPSPKGSEPAAAPASPPATAAAPQDGLLAAAEANGSAAAAGTPKTSPPPPQVEPPFRQSPSPPASELEDSLNFALPPEVISSKVSEAFGQMVAASLQSSKWDKRAQALKGVSAVLKGLEMQGRAPPGSTGALGKGLRLRDRAACWRTGCLLLNQVLRDKVIPIRLAALDLFLDAFSSGAVSAVPQEELSHALDVLSEHLIDRLGDSNLRLHESARKCLLFAAERAELLGLKPGLAKLHARLGKAGKSGERAKVHFGILDAVNFLLQHFPGSRGSGHIDDDLDDDEEAEAHQAPEDSWTQRDIAPFIIAGMDDSLGPRVRDCAAALAVTVYQTFGMEAMRPIMADLRPAKQALLKQKFEEFEGFDPEEEGDDEEGPELRPADLDGLVICGSAIKPQNQLPAKPAPPLPGCVNTDYDEEFIMDGILEDAGMVFSGTGIIGEAALAPRLPPGFLEEHLGISGMDLDEDDHRFLEEELAMHLAMGGPEGLDEQQALLMSLQEGHSFSRGEMSVEVF